MNATDEKRLLQEFALWLASQPAVDGVVTFDRAALAERLGLHPFDLVNLLNAAKREMNITISADRITLKRKGGRPRKRPEKTDNELEAIRQNLKRARESGDMRPPMQIYMDYISRS